MQVEYTCACVLGIAFEFVVLIGTIGSMLLIVAAHLSFKKLREYFVSSEDELPPVVSPPEASSPSLQIERERSEHRVRVAHAERRVQVRRPMAEKNAASWESKVKNVSQNGYRN